MLWLMSHVLTTEDRLQKQMNNDYQVALEKAWWDKLVTKKPSTGRQEFYAFLLTTASIVDLPKGQMQYDELFTQTMVGVNRDRGKGLQVTRNQFTDDGFGFAGEWAGQMGANMALDPQYLAVDLYAVGETKLCYDGLAYFHAAHPVNPFDASLSTYRNLVTDLSQLDPALSGAPVLNAANFALGVALIQGFRMPNGRNRQLEPALLVHGPKQRFAAHTVTGAKFIPAQLTGGSAGTADNVLTDYKVEPLCINEITDNSWGLVSTAAGSDLLPIVYQEREQFYMTSYTGMTQAQLNRENMLEWQVRGRADAFFGHPYQWVKFKVT